jgi:hypothetical protein
LPHPARSEAARTVVMAIVFIMGEVAISTAQTQRPA